MIGWYALVDHEVIGPFDLGDPAYTAQHTRRYEMLRETGEDPWRVAFTEITDEIYVSTVFLGLNHRYWGDGPPLVFETMVFPDGEWCERTSTWWQAEAMHKRAVAEVTVGHLGADET